MPIPSTIRAGDTVAWRQDASTDAFGNPVTSADYSLTYWLRMNGAGDGAEITGVANGVAFGHGWELTIPPAVSGAFTAGVWYWQAIASKAGGDVITIGSGQVTVLASLSYAGSTGPYDGRSQTQQDLDAVQAAIRAMVSGGAVAEYAIGSRRLKKMPLAELLQLEAKLKAELKRELAAQMAANGMGNPHNLFVRFT